MSDSAIEQVMPRAMILAGMSMAIADELESLAKSGTQLNCDPSRLRTAAIDLRDVVAALHRREVK